MSLDCGRNVEETRQIPQHTEHKWDSNPQRWMWHAAEPPLPPVSCLWTSKMHWKFMCLFVCFYRRDKLMAAQWTRKKIIASLNIIQVKTFDTQTEIDNGCSGKLCRRRASACFWCPVIISALLLWCLLKANFLPGFLALQTANWIQMNFWEKLCHFSTASQSPAKWGCTENLQKLDRSHLLLEQWTVLGEKCHNDSGYFSQDSFYTGMKIIFYPDLSMYLCRGRVQTQGRE